jgi:hypothetical protein
MKIEFKLLEKDSDIANSIFRAIQDSLTTIMTKASPEIQRRVKEILTESLRSEPEYQSLKSGILRAEFGIQYPDTVDKIVEKLSETVTIDNIPITFTSRGIKGGFRLVAIQSDNISGLIEDADAFVADDARGYKLPWLEWLLLRGSDKIIKNYEVSFGASKYSRSGMAIMKDSSSSWRVPPQFAGTVKNNWTTRAVSKAEDSIQSAIISTIENYL